VRFCHLRLICLTSEYGNATQREGTLGHVLTNFEIEEAHKYWNTFKGLVKAKANQQNLQSREISANEIEVTATNNRALYVTFAPTDSLRQLRYELQNGRNEPLEFVFDGRPYFRLNEVSLFGRSVVGEIGPNSMEPR